MKKIFRSLALLLCVTSFAIGALSCESRAQKEARAKADAEKQRIKEQIQSSDGLRQYLKGKTFAYHRDFRYTWIKLSFSNTNEAIIYRASSKDRNWGKGEKCTYKVEDETDNYGKKNGYKITLNGLRFSDYYIYLSDYSHLETTPDILGREVMFERIDLDETEANYIPIQWRD